MRSMTEGATREWRSNWTLVLASAVGFSFFSVMLAATGLFIEPLGEEFGWSRTLVSSGPSVATITTALLSPLVGLLIDKYGTRRIALPGIALTMASIAAFSLTSGAALQWLLLWCFFGVVSATIKSTAWTAAVVGSFQRSRGLALGFTLAGTALSQTLVPPMGNWLISSFGWRSAFLILALGWGGLTFLICALFFHDQRARRQAGARGGASGKEDLAEAPGLTPREALVNSALWRLGISSFVVMLLTIGLGIHLIPILTEAGVSRSNAAWLASLAGAAGLAGKLITGVLLDRFQPNWTGGLTLGAAAFAFLLLMENLRSPGLIMVAMLINGYAAGTKMQITGFLASRYAGMKAFGTIYGVLAAVLALASGLGPTFAGLIYDFAGGYEPFLAIGAGGCILGGVLIASLPAYPSWEKPDADEPVAPRAAEHDPVPGGSAAGV